MGRHPLKGSSEPVGQHPLKGRPLLPALERQRQEDVCEFEASLVLIVNSDSQVYIVRPCKEKGSEEDGNHKRTHIHCLRDLWSHRAI